MDRKRDTKIIFVGNYKGGVGKTTSVLNFAEYFSLEYNKNFHDRRNTVLVLDIDPQSSLSEILVQKGNYGTLSDLKESETLNYIFDLNISKIEKYPNIVLKFDKRIIKTSGSYDFIPSSLFYRQDMGVDTNLGLDTLAIRMKDNIQYLSILKEFVDTIKHDYDYILIDCPPANNLITRSAFLMSDYYIIPTILDGLSANGVIHYINTVNEIYDKYCRNSEDALLTKHYFGEKPELLGIFYNLRRAQVNYDDARKDFELSLKKAGYSDVCIFDHVVNNYISIARDTQNGNAAISKNDFKNLAKEILKKI